MAVNVNITTIPMPELHALCAAFLEATLRFYELPKNREGFEQWLEGRKGGNVDGQESSSTASAELSNPCSVEDSGAAAGRV